MKISKTLTSAVVAAALVGGIGIAYAQTGTSSGGQEGGNGNTTLQPVPMQNQPATADMNAAPATTPSTSADTGFQTERPAQPDRN